MRNARIDVLRKFLFILIIIWSIDSNSYAQFYKDVGYFHFIQDQNDTDTNRVINVLKDSVVLGKYELNYIDFCSWSFEEEISASSVRSSNGFFVSYSEINSDIGKQARVDSFQIQHFRKDSLLNVIPVKGRSLSEEQMEYCFLNFRKGDSVLILNVNIGFDKNEIVCLSDTLIYLVQKDTYQSAYLLRKSYAEELEYIYTRNSIKYLSDKYCASYLIGVHCTVELCETQGLLILEHFYNFPNLTVSYVYDITSDKYYVIDGNSNMLHSISSWERKVSRLY